MDEQTLVNEEEPLVSEQPLESEKNAGHEEMQENARNDQPPAVEQEQPTPKAKRRLVVGTPERVVGRSRSQEQVATMSKVSRLLERQTKPGRGRMIPQLGDHLLSSLNLDLLQGPQRIRRRQQRIL